MDKARSVVEAIGDTPLIRLRRASDMTGCEIWAKAEFMNPGQSVKDRAALFIIRDAEKRGLLKPGGTIVEGTAGNTGIGLAMVAGALGYKSVIVIPRTQSQEKKDAIRLLGAELVEVDAVPYSNPGNYVRYSGALAEKLAATEPNGVIWANQFDNVANRQAHIETTAQEIWDQTGGKVDGFVSAVGSGGTLAGVAMGLREKNKHVQVCLADPFGAALFNWYTAGELKSEGTSITEGIGQGRITTNLEGLTVDHAYQIPDAEALEVIYDLVLHEGLVMGGSTGVNIAGAIRLARELGPGKTIVTLLCDHGSRYQSKIFNPAFLRERGLPTPLLDTRLMDPIVSTAWLAERLKEPDLRIVDAPFYMPGDDRTPRGEFEKEHIPGAVLFDLEAISDHDNPLPHMLAPADAFAQAVGRLGISDGDRIVVYDHMGLLSAARVWWNFRAMGHDEVYVLDGGLPRWIAEGRPLADGPVTSVPQVFTPVFRPALVRDLRQVEAGLAGGIQVLDARPRGRFQGTEPEPRPGLSSGHMPGARNTPHAELIENGALKSKAALQALFRGEDVDVDKPVITTCGSGVSAAIIALALARLGKWDAPVYDGSWTEWASTPGVRIASGF